VDENADPQTDYALAWELLYRLEPHLYDRLVRAEPLHPGILEWLPAHVPRIVEVAAGSGRLTAELVKRCDELTAIEPAAPLRQVLAGKLHASQSGLHRAANARGADASVNVTGGFFDDLPLVSRSAELVIACSALTADPRHGADQGLAEMERVCTVPGMVVIVWPNDVPWLAGRGYIYRSFPGDMRMVFESHDDAVAMASIFFPDAVQEITRRGDRCVPYDLLGVNPPRDLAYKMLG
jgi:SAM-dependent methyltransferase